MLHLGRGHRRAPLGVQREDDVSRPCQGELRERRRQPWHYEYKRPELMATALGCQLAARPGAREILLPVLAQHLQPSSCAVEAPEGRLISGAVSRRRPAMTGIG